MARPLGEDELLRLIDALASGEWCSGEALAGEAGVTRAALAKRVSHLRDWGLDVEAEAGRGYRLSQPLQRLDAAAIRAALAPATRERLRGVEVLARTDSTNQRLLEADAAQDPQALFAELQTAGRGRRGRNWRSPFGANLYLSLSWTFPAWPPQLSALSLAVGVACARALRATGLEAVMLKWPNDLRVGEAKLGGILIEQRGEAGGACRVVIGIGINVAMTLAQAGELGQPWISLQDALAFSSLSPKTPLAPGSPEGAYRGASPDAKAFNRNKLAAGLLDQLMSALQQFDLAGFAPFLHDWNALDLTANQPVRIEGAEPLQGIARGVDPQGALIVEAQGQRRHVHSGEVSLRLGDAP